MKIMGIKGRATVLRSVSTTIGMPGEDIVPPEEQIERMEQSEQKVQQSGTQTLDAMIQKKVEEGVANAAGLIAKEITAAKLAMQEQMPDGKPIHIGTPSGNEGQTSTNNPGMDMNQQQSSPHPTGSTAHGAAQAQGAQPSHLSQSMGPQTHLTGNQPGAGAKPVTGGVG